VGSLATAPLTYTPQHLTEQIFTSRRALEGERKQVTVLFADLKDSTEFIKDLDPEAAQQLLDPAIHLMMDAVHRFEGTVNQVLGDGIMSIFGAPIAHEDHALRACYAALAMQAAMRDYTEEVRRSHGMTMRMRVGLHSGEVVVRTISNDLHMDYSAVGHTTHLASRMEQLAAPGSITLTRTTLRLVEGLVQVHHLGPVPVKGMTAPVEVYELTGASSIRGRFQAAVARGLTQFVGRETETDALNQALEQAGAGHGQIVAAVGEAGVGKSRLMYEFVHAPRTQGWPVLESASVSYGKATPYFPVLDVLKRYIHVEDGDDLRTIRAKVTGHIVTLDEALQDIIPALLSLLDALPEDSAFLYLDPPQRRQRTLEGLTRLLVRESQVQPLLLVFEDLHWQDAESQAVLDTLVESLPTAHLLLLVNYRPEYTHGWGNKAYHTQLQLDPLPPASADAFLAALLGDDESLDPLKQLLIARTEGNPFFLEESVRTLVETQVLAGAPGTYRLAHALPTIQVPATVQAVLAARIDRLAPDEKRLVQTAAVIGTEVPFALLQAIAEVSEAALHRGLIHLQAAELLYETRLFPERVYTFKHALTHEVAYSSLLQERRRVLHARIVEALETRGGERLAEQVKRLAQHAFQGEVWEKALTYFRHAGEEAIVRSAHREAVTCFERALEALQHLPEGRDMMEQAMTLCLALRSVLQPLGEFAQLYVILRKAEALAETLDDRRRLGQIASHISNYFWWSGDPARAVAYGQRAVTLATPSGDVAFQASLRFQLGLAYHALGDYARSIALHSEVMASLTGDLLYKHPITPNLTSVTSRTMLVWGLAERGAFAEGRTHGAEGVRIAEAAAHQGSLMRICFGVGQLYLCQGALPQAMALLERSVSLCQLAETPLWFPLVAAHLGYAYALSGRLADAVRLLEQATKQSAAKRLMAYHTLQVTYLSAAYLRSGRMEDATAHALQALAFSEAHKTRGDQAHALCLLGDIAMQRDRLEINHAETYYQQGLTLANELGMRPLQAHCHRGLGTLYATIGQRKQAHSELSAAIEMYRTMDMTFWLPQAEAALAEVEGG
jgi:class 3 adenylate cyclase/tetratricopeptide (TPR) repeat protein